MKQLGNLAVVCARRKDVLMLIQGAEVLLFIGEGQDMETAQMYWDDDTEISRMIRELNFGKYAKENLYD